MITMIRNLLLKLTLIQISICLNIQSIHARTDLSGPHPLLLKKIESTGGLVALWKFTEKPGKKRMASGLGKFPLNESGSRIPRWQFLAEPSQFTDRSTEHFRGKRRSYSYRMDQMDRRTNGVCRWNVE